MPFFSLRVEIYRPEHANDQSHSVNAFAGSDNGGACYSFDRTVELAKRFDLPDVLKGPYLLEKAREDALYSKDRKWVLLCLYVRSLLQLHP